MRINKARGDRAVTTKSRRESGARERAGINFQFDHGGERRRAIKLMSLGDRKVAPVGSSGSSREITTFLGDRANSTYAGRHAGERIKSG